LFSRSLDAGRLHQARLAANLLVAGLPGQESLEPRVADYTPASVDLAGLRRGGFAEGDLKFWMRAWSVHRRTQQIPGGSLQPLVDALYQASPEGEVGAGRLHPICEGARQRGWDCTLLATETGEMLPLIELWHPDGRFRLVTVKSGARVLDGIPSAWLSGVYPSSLRKLWNGDLRVARRLIPVWPEQFCIRTQAIGQLLEAAGFEDPLRLSDSPMWRLRRLQDRTSQNTEGPTVPLQFLPISEFE
jgi:hypothetical protein